MRRVNLRAGAVPAGSVDSVGISNEIIEAMGQNFVAVVKLERSTMRTVRNEFFFTLTDLDRSNITLVFKFVNIKIIGIILHIEHHCKEV